MHHVIVGSGPTSIALTLMLCQNDNNKITILESQDYVGGCWNVEYVDEKYYSEHSGKVMFTYDYFNQLLIYLDIDPNKAYTSIYGNPFTVMTKFTKFMWNGLKYIEMIYFLSAIIQCEMNIFDKTMSLHDWLIKYNFSDKGYQTFRILAIAAADVPENLLAHVLFSSVHTDAFNIRQLKDQTHWINTYKTYIESKPNVNLMLNHEVKSINNVDDNYVNYVMVKDKSSGKLVKVYGDQFMCCIPPTRMMSITNSSSNIIQNNWLEHYKFINWCESSSYTSFGFQLHFNVQITFPKEWCWSCVGDWNIIALDTSKYSNIYTKDDHNGVIKTVWSCCIIDLNARSNHINKTVNDCSYDEVIDESIRQLEKLVNHKLNPAKITSYSGLQRINNKWVSHDSSYVNSKSIMKSKGTLKNLFWIGSHNIGQITNLETAVKSAVEFGQEYNFNAIFYHKCSFHIAYIMLIMIIIIIIICT